MTLDAAEGEVLAVDAAAFALALSDPAAKARYERLTSAAAAGTIPEDLVPALEAMLELLFEKGRPSNPAVLQAVFGKTARGRRQSSAARDVNQALRTLRGQVLQDVRLATGPSRHTLVVETDRCRLTLELDRDGAQVTVLEAG